MGIDSPYIVQGLNEKDSWELFESLAFRKGEESSSKLVEIGREIAKMCKGLPLAIATIGRMLYFKTPQESQWLSIKNNRSLISLGDENDNDILSVLRLSYDNLPVHLKNCFAYCALFPKDYEMEKRWLVQLWMAQGYIQPSLENECLEDVGEEYLKDLFSRSLFQEFQEPHHVSVLPYCYYKMHDLIHDLAQSVVKSNMMTLAAHNVSAVIIPRTVRHVWSSGETRDLPKDLLEKPIRTIYMETPSSSSAGSITSASVSRLKCLRVMSISFNDGKVLTSLAKLSHLHYLDLSHSMFEYLPRTIARLNNLETLKLNSCAKLRELPKNMKKLTNLRHLETAQSRALRYMPCGLGQLTQLQTLTLFQPGSERYGKHATLWELKRLDNLRGQLEIKWLKQVRWCIEDAEEAILGGKQYLESLSLVWGEPHPRLYGLKIREEAVLLMGSLQPHPNLKVLSIYCYPGVTFPNWMMNDGLHLLLPNLVSFILGNSSACQVLPPFSQLPSLRYLLLDDLPDVVRMEDTSLSAANPPALGLFPSLTSLGICRVPKWKGLGRRDAVAAAEHALFPSLGRLSLENITAGLCSHLMMGASSSLETLGISYMPDLTCLPEEGLQQLSNLRSLSISHCYNMTTLPSSIGLLTSLRELSIFGCHRLTSLPEEMRSLHNLLELIIMRCDILSRRCQKDTGDDWPKISHIPRIFHD